MIQSTINQRLKYLIEKVNLNAKVFSERIEESPATTHNYIGKRQTEPRAQYLSKVLSHFADINARWLMTGQGEAFGPEVAESTSSVSNNKIISRSLVVSGKVGRDAIHNQGASASELAAAQREIEFLKTQVASKQHIIESKDEIIQLLKASQPKP